MRTRTAAICLRTNDYSETSQIVRFFTRDVGAVRVIAKGAKRPKSKTGGALDLLSEGELVFSTPKRNPDALGTLIEFAETTSRRALRSDGKRLNTGLFLLELSAECIADHDPHPRIYDLLHGALERLGESDAPVGAVLAWFQWRLLRNLGLLGELHACVECHQSLPVSGRSGGWYFTSRLGGALCPNCCGHAPEKTPLTGEAQSGIAILTHVENRRNTPLPTAEAQAVNRLLAYHIAQQLGKKLRMARFAVS